MNDYQQPDFKSGKIIAICQKHKISVLRMMNPPIVRTPDPNRPLHLIAEYLGSKTVSTTELTILGVDLTNALGHKVSVVNLEEMPRHSRVAAMTDSKVVYA
jgi:hypothetical protein